MIPVPLLWATVPQITNRELQRIPGTSIGEVSVQLLNRTDFIALCCQLRRSYKTYSPHDQSPGIDTSGRGVELNAPLLFGPVDWDPAAAFQHRVSMWYNSGEMDHWLQAHIHTHRTRR